MSKEKWDHIQDLIDKVINDDKKISDIMPVLEKLSDEEKEIVIKYIDEKPLTKKELLEFSENFSSYDDESLLDIEEMDITGLERTKLRKNLKNTKLFRFKRKRKN